MIRVAELGCWVSDVWRGGVAFGMSCGQWLYRTLRVQLYAGKARYPGTLQPVPLYAVHHSLFDNVNYNKEYELNSTKTHFQILKHINQLQMTNAQTFLRKYPTEKKKQSIYLSAPRTIVVVLPLLSLLTHLYLQHSLSLILNNVPPDPIHNELLLKH